jgi:hypothetical protein
MATLDTYYWNNPVSVIDQNSWTTYHPEVALLFRNRAVYTPLVDWTNEPQTTGGLTNVQTELLEPDVNADEIPLTATSIDALGVDSRSRQYTVKRYAGAVQLNEMSNVFQQWQFGGGRDWRPVLRGVLGNDVINKHEMLARNIFLSSPTARWTYGGSATSIGTVGSSDKFDLDSVIDWNFRLGNTGSPVIPGDMAAAKVAIIPPGVTYDLRKSLASATTNEAQMWRDARIYSGQALNYEIGEFSGVRFVENPSNKFGINNAVLYNCGAITKQYGVTVRINAGDGAPDPETTTVDGVWQVGQKNVTHTITLENFANHDFEVNDIVTIHTKRTSTYGVTNGVDPLDGTAIQRRVVAVDYSANTLSFDRPIMANYHVPLTTAAGSVTGATPGTFYAFVTKGRSIGMVLVMGSRGGVLGATARPLRFYEPKPIDQFESIWRFSYDMVLGHNVWEPNYFELHFCAVSLPKPGGVIAP